MSDFKELVQATMEDNPELSYDEAETLTLENLISWAETYEPMEGN